MDYDSGPYTVTFLAGSTTATFNVPINDDDILEGNETFMLTIDPSLPDGVTRGTPSEATVTIVDDDRKFYYQWFCCLICHMYLYLFLHIKHMCMCMCNIWG